jgi:hypothetical protein
VPARIDAARLRKRIGPYLLGIALAALASRGLAAIVPMEIAVGLGAVVSLGVPGWALVRVAGLDRRLGPAGAVAVLPVAGLIVWAPPLAVGFLLGLPFAVVLAAVLLLAAVGLAACEPFDFAAVDRAEAAGLTLAALAAGAVGWYYQAGIGAGDALFHAGRVRKLIELDGLSLTGVSTYLDGPPHAGYAFPLLHAAQAGAVKLGGGDPSVTYVSLVPVFVCLVPLAVYGAGKAVAGPSVGAAAALFACWDALVPGSWPLSLQWTEQPPTFTFVVLLPIGVLAAHELRRSPSDRSVQALSVGTVCVVAFVHPTYVFPLLAITTGIALLAWSGFRTLVVSYAAGAAILLWIWWEALHGAPPAGAFEPTYRSGVGTLFHHNAMLSGGSILQHRGPFLIAMLAMVVLLVAWGRRYALAAATMLGPFVLVALPGALAVLVPIVNLAQARRFWIAIPWPYVAALVVALVVARFAGRRVVWPVIGAVALSYLMRQDFHLLWTRWATELTSATAVAGLGIAIWQIATRRRAGPAPAVAAGVLPTLLVTAALLSVPAVAHDYSRTAPSGHKGVSEGVIDYLRAHDGAPFPVVLADLRPAYTMSGRASVYVVAVNEGHMRAEPKIDPPRRRADVNRFLDPATSEAVRDEIMRRYDVRYAIVAEDSPMLGALRADPELRQVYADGPNTVADKRVIFERRS